MHLVIIGGGPVKHFPILIADDAIVSHFSLSLSLSFLLLAFFHPQPGSNANRWRGTQHPIGRQVNAFMIKDDKDNEHNVINKLDDSDDEKEGVFYGENVDSEMESRVSRPTRES